MTLQWGSDIARNITSLTVTLCKDFKEVLLRSIKFLGFYNTIFFIQAPLI